MSTHAERLWHQRSALRAFLARVMGRNLNDSTTSVFGFVFENEHEHVPPGILDTLGEVVILEHPGDVQVLYEDVAVSVGVGLGSLEHEVSALSFHLQVQHGSRPASPSSPMAPLLPTGDAALLDPEFVLGLSEEPRSLDRMSIRVSKEGF